MLEVLSMTTWVQCPICGEPDMRCETEDDVNYISCANGNCASNGGTNASHFLSMYFHLNPSIKLVTDEEYAKMQQIRESHSEPTEVLKELFRMGKSLLKK